MLIATPDVAPAETVVDPPRGEAISRSLTPLTVGALNVMVEVAPVVLKLVAPAFSRKIYGLVTVRLVLPATVSPLLICTNAPVLDTDVEMDMVAAAAAVFRFRVLVPDPLTENVRF